MSNANFKQENNHIFNYKSFVLLLFVITAIAINYFHSISMMLLTTFVLAYSTKGSRRSNL